MKRYIPIIMIVALMAFFGSMLSADNQRDVGLLMFNLGTTEATGTAVTGVFRVPQACKIDSIPIVDQACITLSATDTATVTFYRNGSAYGAYVTSSGALAANTPVSLTPTASVLAAGDVLQFRLTKSATGKATAGLGVSIAYHNAN